MAEENFQTFFECWLSEQNQKLQELISVSNQEQKNANDEQVLNELINGVIEHYEVYYRAKAGWAKHDVLYSISVLQLESHLADLIRRLRFGGLAELSADQIGQVDRLQTRTITEEKEITEKMSKHQQTMADTSMVELSHVITELINNDGDDGGGGEGTEEKRWVELLARAGDLRLRTLKAVLEILTPIQAVHFLIAAAELHLRLHGWGNERDTRSGCEEN